MVLEVNRNNYPADWMVLEERRYKTRFTAFRAVGSGQLGIAGLDKNLPVSATIYARPSYINLRSGKISENCHLEDHLHLPKL
jgi:hypothetical protein